MEEESKFEEEYTKFLAKQKQILEAKADVACAAGDSSTLTFVADDGAKLAIAAPKSGLTVSQLGTTLSDLAVDPNIWKSNEGIYAGHENPWIIDTKCKIDTGLTKMNSNDAMLLDYLKKQFTPIAEGTGFTELGEKLKAKLREKLGDNKICIRIASDGNVYIEERANNATVCMITHNLVSFMIPYRSETKALLIRGEEDLYKVVKGVEILTDYWEEEKQKERKLRHMLNALDVFE
jgi:hypothetical protein